MKVVEIFQSIQGEGSHMGKWATFVRFAGCNLSCPFCDEASKYTSVKEMTVEEIMSKIDTEFVVLTGGEPTCQDESNMRRLIKSLRATNHYVAMETNGTQYAPINLNWITCSPKYPKYELNCHYDEVKVVVDDIIMETPSILRDIASKVLGSIWLQPCDGPNLERSKKFIIDFLSKDKSLKFKAGIQLHKYYEVV